MKRIIEGPVRVRVPPRDADTGAKDYLRLTTRERQVVAWLASGSTDRQIASGLGLSPRTVQKHLEHVYQKLGVATRTAAVMRVIGPLTDAVR